jgi:UDP-N-acetylglucosamine acyltransferase
MTVKDRFTVLGVNVVGMRRSGYSAADILTARRAFHILYRSDEMLRPAIDRLAAALGDQPVVAEILEFIRQSKRGVMRSVRGGAADPDE